MLLSMRDVIEEEFIRGSGGEDERRPRLSRDLQGSRSATCLVMLRDLELPLEQTGGWLIISSSRSNVLGLNHSGKSASAPPPGGVYRPANG